MRRSRRERREKRGRERYRRAGVYEEANGELLKERNRSEDL